MYCSKKNRISTYHILLIAVIVVGLLFMLSQIVKAETEQIRITIHAGDSALTNPDNWEDFDGSETVISIGKDELTEFGWSAIPNDASYILAGVYTKPNGQGEKIDTIINIADFEKNKYWFNCFYSASEDTDIYLYWINDPITITYNSNGGTFTSLSEDGITYKQKRAPNVKWQEYLNNDYVGSSGMITRSNAEFLGWSTDPNSTNGIAASDLMFEEDTTVYAVWKINNYTVTITNGIFDEKGNETQYQKTVKDGETAPLQFTLYDFYNNLNPSKFFGGVFTAPNGTGTQVIKECTYNADKGTYYIDDKYTPSEDIVLHINWRSGVTLVLDANGGLFEDGNPKRVQNRAPNVIWKEVRADSSYYVPTKDGYEFVGWNTNPNGISGFELEDYMASGSTTLYAVWKELPHEHVEETVSAKPATCTEDGLTEGKKCSVCGEWIVKQETIPAKGHHVVTIPSVAATCTEIGSTEGKRCDQCGLLIQRPEDIPALGHTIQIIIEVPASCTEDGLTEGKKCSVCGEVILTQDVIPAKGHSVEVIKGKAATCTEKGLTDGKKCSICNTVLEAQKEIPAKGHNPEDIAAVEATCTEAGKTAGKKCSVCGAVIEAQKEVPAKGHTEEVIKGKAATCTESGMTDGKKCFVCNAVLEEQKVIPAFSHSEEVVKGKAATCIEKGLTDGKKCSVCNTILEEQKEIPALGHDFKDGKCTRCDAVDPNYKPTPIEPVNKFTGLANEADKDGVWWYYTDGKIDKTHTGVDQNKYGWWRVENGKVNFNAQSIYQNSFGWWKTTNGKVTFKEEGVFQNGFGWWRVKDSKVDFNAQSIYQNQYGWWKTTNGKVTFKESGLFKNQYGIWKVENSKVNFNFNGNYQGKTIKNGKVV